MAKSKKSSGFKSLADQLANLDDPAPRGKLRTSQLTFESTGKLICGQISIPKTPMPGLSRKLKMKVARRLMRMLAVSITKSSGELP